MRIAGDAECKKAPLPLISTPMVPVWGGVTSDVLETSKNAVTVAFGLRDTRFPIDTMTLELIWALALLHETDESDFQRFASQDEKRTRNCGVADNVPNDFPRN
jgi:hypothetical protein